MSRVDNVEKNPERVRLRDGRWAAIEVKLGKKQIDEAAEKLLALKARIDEDKMGEASFLMVITGGQYDFFPLTHYQLLFQD